MHVTVEVVGEGRRSTTSPTTPPTPTSFARPATILRRRRRWSTARRFLATASSTPNRSGCSGLSRADRRAAARERGRATRPTRPTRRTISKSGRPHPTTASIFSVLDAAMLETDAETVDAAIDAGDALVARFKRTDAVVGALVATARVGPSSRRRRGRPAGASRPRDRLRARRRDGAARRARRRECGRHRRVRSGTEGILHRFGVRRRQRTRRSRDGPFARSLPGRRWQRRRRVNRRTTPINGRTIYDGAMSGKDEYYNKSKQQGYAPGRPTS